MAKIKKTIQNLKPGKQYLLTVKPRDADVNTVLDPTSAVRFVIPADLTQPQELGNLVIVGNYKSIMISFNPSNEADLSGYNYEVYFPESIQQVGSSYSIISGQTPFLSGFSLANVISIDVPENTGSTNTIDSNTGVTTTTTTEKVYFARVQSIDTSGNKSSWTPITASTATTLIDSAHIVNLTASKLTAGTIGAHTITLAGGTSIIKSSTFNGVDVGGGSYANATTGWLINGSGRAYFYDATIAGSIDIGGFDSGSFHVDSEGNLWLGSGTLVNAPFKVLKEGDVTAKTLTLTGVTKLSTESSSNAKIYLGNGNYNNLDTPFYVDNTSQFSLGDKLTWDGTSLTVKGILKFPDNTEPVSEQEAEDIAEEAVEELENNIYEEGFLGGLTIDSTKMHYGVGNFASSDTAFYVGKNLGSGQADFSLGNKLSWNGSTLIITGNITASTGKIGNWIIDQGGRLTSNEEDPLFVLSPGEDQEGAIRFGSVRIGNGDIQSESLEINSDTEAIYYSGTATRFNAPNHSFAFYYSGTQLRAVVYGANGNVIKNYCIAECSTGTSPTNAPTSTTATSAPGTTTTTTTTSTAATTAPPACSDDTDCSPGKICVSGTCVNQTTATTTSTTATTTTTTTTPCGNYACGFGFCDSCQGCVCNNGLCMCP